jgi:hypothetical protein
MIIARRQARLQASKKKRAALTGGFHPDEIVSNKSDAHLTCIWRSIVSFFNSQYTL